MTIANAMYSLLIGPLELLFEVLFALVRRILPNPGFGICFLSLVINLLLLPMYRRADAVQEEERNKQIALKPMTEHIRRTFRGDERYMMLTAYYRENNRRQTDALKGLLPLALEIPFFIAAYHFLSGLELLRGVPFGPIADLGLPDGLLPIGSRRVNALPVLMTAINCLSTAVYTRGYPRQTKIQLYGMAAAFLVFLYTSPSGLVLYWTLNNLFSLSKNLFTAVKKPKELPALICTAAGIILAAAAIAAFSAGRRRPAFVYLTAALSLQIPTIVRIVQKKPCLPTPGKHPRPDARLFLYAGLLLTFLMGVQIPAGVIQSSPQEFINYLEYKSQLWYVLNSLLLSSGTFLIWCGIFYMLSGKRIRHAIESVMMVGAGAAVTDVLFFGKNLGMLRPTLNFVKKMSFAPQEILVNLAVLAAVLLLLLIFRCFAAELARTIVFAAAMAVFVIGCVNTAGIINGMDKTQKIVDRAMKGTPAPTFSKQRKNVVVIMLDRAIGLYLPYCFAEKPELYDKFAGFTFYPNTLSFGAHTSQGSPPVFGGYEYTPEEINKRRDVLLVEKQNEALRLMPVLFAENGFETTVCDPVYAGYSWIPDLSIYDDHPGINACITLGRYELPDHPMSARLERDWMRNFFCYSFMKAAPVVLQPLLYSDGLYNDPDAIAAREENNYSGKSSAYTIQNYESMYSAEGINKGFAESYAVLLNLPRISKAGDSKNGCFLMMVNNTTHDFMMLQEPEYEPETWVDNEDYEAEHADRFTLNGKTLMIRDPLGMMLYQCNMAAYLKLGDWFDWMRKEGVYDSTKIIIVADHGYHSMNQLEGIAFGSYTDFENVETFNPLLLVKDFDSREFKTDNRFMTNADVPALAFRGVIENPVNPATGKPVDDKAKEKPQHVFLSQENGTPLKAHIFKTGQWYSVHDDIFNISNWTKIGDTLPERP